MPTELIEAYDRLLAADGCAKNEAEELVGDPGWWPRLPGRAWLMCVPAWSGGSGVAVARRTGTRAVGSPGRASEPPGPGADLAIRAGLAATLVGAPWQALYVFRGARPEVVAELVSRAGTRIMPLTRSFRWRDDSQRQLADGLRAGSPVTLPAAAHDAAGLGADVVLSLYWKPLWQAGDHVLPLAFHAFKGGSEEAAATLLLNHVTRNIFSEDATYLRDALTALAIDNPDTPRMLEPQLQEVVEALRAPGRAALNAAYGKLSDVVATVSPRTLRAAHPAHTGRLAEIGTRIRYPGRPVPGLTTHQAKGREWEVVEVRLAASEREALAAGLDVRVESHRQLYVACTRARRATTAAS